MIIDIDYIDQKKPKPFKHWGPIQDLKIETPPTQHPQTRAQCEGNRTVLQNGPVLGALWWIPMALLGAKTLPPPTPKLMVGEKASMPLPPTPPPHLLLYLTLISVSIRCSAVFLNRGCLVNCFCFPPVVCSICTAAGEIDSQSPLFTDWSSWSENCELTWREKPQS